MDEFSPQGLGNLAWAYAKQAQLAAGVSDSTISSTGRLAVYETSCLDVGEELIQRLFAGIAEASINNLDRFKPQDLSNTCWAFATLGLLHKQFFNSVATQICERWVPINIFFTIYLFSSHNITILFMQGHIFTAKDDDQF